MPDATFACPDLTIFCRLDELGLEVTGQRVEPERAVLACRVVEPDRWCRRCGCEGTARDTPIRRLAHEPFGWRPTTLLVTVRRYRCTGCGHVWRQDTSKAAEPRAKLSRRGLRWALEGLVCQHLTVARIAEGLAVSWTTANDAVLAEGRRVLINDPQRFDGVTHRSGSTTEQVSTARSASTRCPVTTRPSSSRRQKVVRSGQAKVASGKSRSSRWMA